MNGPAECTAIRALLSRPLIGADQPDVLADVRRHRRELERFFSEELGYRLDASRPGRARLAKVPGPAHEPRGLCTRGGKPFDRRRYSLVCLVLASAEAAGERTTLARLFADVAARAAGVEGLAFATERASDRRVFVQAVQALETIGVLELAQGDEERFARGEADADALYRIDRERLALLPTTSAPPSLLASLGEGIRCLPLKGRVPAACWDTELAPAVTAAGVEVEEELVLDLLLSDLGCEPGGDHGN